jgi:hypothetical protein
MRNATGAGPIDPNRHRRRERAVLTSRFAERASASDAIVRVGCAIVLSIAASTSALAGGVGGLNCIRSATSFNCVGQWAPAGDPYVRAVPEVLGDEAKAQASLRDQKWLAHCRPRVVRDIYGVARYQYATLGCEYGLGVE